ncbi:hypothetical protein CY34DRAFT_708761 [Suillus luteus UH-Slu-Lm8-n1]|uniref:Uncharacterized protein n=1 Tax=Suillus luteus UH-Slu-Lm8-n1 TaxID=930992 RepID=A0A0D0BB94_9AGAM|nr:hypothetical protein CY34DRAFT_708761 [Suillus luteus UH-Slu-Lm8-n1]
MTLAHLYCVPLRRACSTSTLTTLAAIIFSNMRAVTPSSVTFQTQTARLAAPPTIMTALSSITLRKKYCWAQKFDGGVWVVL